MLLGVLSVTAIGFLLWLLFTLAVYALPVWAGAAAAWLAYHTGAGWLGAGIVGLVVAGLTIGFGEAAQARLRSPVARRAVALLFAIPAAIAGYHAAHGILKWSVDSDAWRIGLSVAAGAIASFIAAARLAAGHVTGSASQASAPQEHAVASPSRIWRQPAAWRRPTQGR